MPYRPGEGEGNYWCKAQGRARERKSSSGPDLTGAMDAAEPNGSF